jgi:murein DD-endopeptidase MepM/ murein hydrolase activator NlpD
VEKLDVGQDQLLYDPSSTMAATMPGAKTAAALGLALLGLSVLAGCAVARPEPAATVPSGWPLPRDVASISSAFGAPRGRSTHQGLDLRAPRGTKVLATADGVVSFAGRSGAYGRLVVLDHGNGWETRYAHLHRIKVEEGKRVRRGRTLGTVGHSGNAGGNHLHYELRRNGVPVDPRPTLGR